MPKRNLLPVLTLITGLLLAAIMILAGLPAPQAAAQGSVPTLTPSLTPTQTLTPTPNATATAAAAAFTVGRAEMVSRYPEGVEFVLEIDSSAGEIVRASVLHWLNNGTPQSARLEWDEEREAFVYYDRMYMPPWIQVNYRFRVTDEAGNIYETKDMVSEYADDSREWTRLENDQVVVLFFGAPESLGNALFESASDSITRLEEAFGYSLDFRPYIVVVPTLADFQEWQEYPDPYMVGVSYWDLGYTAQILQLGELDLTQAIIPHEMTHVFQGYTREARDIPSWFIEGQATYFERVQDYDYAARVRRLADQLPSLQGDISLEFPGPDGQIRWAYDVGYTFITYWVDRFGWEANRIFWQVQQEMSFYEAIEYASGVPFETLENEWRASVGAGGPAPTLIPTPTLLAFPTAPGMSGGG